MLKRYLDSGGDAEKKDKEYGAAPVHWAALVSETGCFHATKSAFVVLPASGVDVVVPGGRVSGTRSPLCKNCVKVVVV